MEPSVLSEPPEWPTAEPADTLLDDRPDRRDRRTWFSALQWVLLIAGALAAALLIKAFLFQAFYIPSESMTPTLQVHDRVLVNKLSYRMHPVHRGDIIVFKAPPNVDPSVKDLVKRVIGLPGETIAGRTDGHVYINGKILNEPWLPKGLRTDPGFAPIKVPTDAYYVLGDNRPNSRDSRYFPTHFVQKKDIIGRVFLRIWPLNRIDIL